MSIRRVNIASPGTLPEGYYELVLHGLPGHPETVAGIEGRDVVTGEMWQACIWVNPEHPVDSLPILVPETVPRTRVKTADEAWDDVDRFIDIDNWENLEEGYFVISGEFSCS